MTNDQTHMLCCREAVYVHAVRAQLPRERLAPHLIHRPILPVRVARDREPDRVGQPDARRGDIELTMPEA